MPATLASGTSANTRTTSSFSQVNSGLVRVEVAACTRSPGLTSRFVTTPSNGATILSYCSSAWSLAVSALAASRSASADVIFAFPGLHVGVRYAFLGLRLVERLGRCGLAGEELLLPLERHLLQREIGLHACELPLCYFERGLGLLHDRLSLVELRLQLRFLDHREHLPFFHMVADIIVDLRDIAGVLGIKIGDEKRLNGRRDDNGRELRALVVTFQLFGNGLAGAGCFGTAPGADWV